MYFSHNINQLLYTYPLTHTTKDGLPFWTLPKRPPTPLNFDLNNDLHVQFVSSFACLWANIWKIAIKLENIRDMKTRRKMMDYLSDYVPSKFVPDDKKKLMDMKITEKKD